MQHEHGNVEMVKVSSKGIGGKTSGKAKGGTKDGIKAKETLGSGKHRKWETDVKATEPAHTRQRNMRAATHWTRKSERAKRNYSAEWGS